MSEDFDRAHQLDIVQDVPTHERSDAAANRALILDAARRLFAEHGVAEVSLADIVQTAGVGRGTLYRRYANKGELCLALLSSQFAEFQDEMLVQFKQMTIEQVPKLELLAHFVDALIHFIDEHIPLLCEVQRDGVQSVGDKTAPYLWLHATVSGLLQAATASGEIASDSDTFCLADAILAPMTAQFYRFMRENRGFEPDRVSASLQALFFGLASTERE